MWKLVVGKDSATNPHLVSLNDFVGRQVWQYDAAAGDAATKAEVETLRARYSHNRHRQRHAGDELLRLQAKLKHGDLAKKQGPLQVPETGPLSESLLQEGLSRGVRFYQTLQSPDGHWPGDYGGPMFLMPGLVITCYITGVLDTVLVPEAKAEMVRYLGNMQNKDGGFGLHIEGHSTMFGTVLSYVTLRILGQSSDAPTCLAARNWITSHGGATYIPSWGKFWLAALGVYSWDGLNPIPPELWLLPYSSWTGIGLLHPGRMWCHCRMVYLPMCVVYGQRHTGPETRLTAALREELYCQSYDSIPWSTARSQCCKADLYYPHPFIQDCLWTVLYYGGEPLLKGSWLRRKAVEECMKLIHYEDNCTRYIDIGPVNKSLNMLAVWFEDPNSEAFKKHVARVHDYLWVAEDGMKMQGYNGSQLWDTSFAVQAIIATGLTREFSTCLKRAHHYLERSQVMTESPQPLSRWYRHISYGAWPFSNQDHGWPIADCTSEGLKAALELLDLGVELAGPSLPPQRLYEAVNVILSYQNATGGWATYENTRSVPALELLNPSEVFGDIMIDYDYVELSSACITALAAFSQRFPVHRQQEISKALNRGINFIKSIQKADGSWYGSWGVCFTYGTWFGCTALAAQGADVSNSNELRRAADFLLHKQRADGGWGESYLSSQDCVYSQYEGQDSHVVNTAWAVLTLISIGYHQVDSKPLLAAARFLLKMQQQSGDWPQQSISGVFNKNCMITYANYRNIFPIWALGQFWNKVIRGEAVAKKQLANGMANGVATSNGSSHQH